MRWTPRVSADLPMNQDVRCSLCLSTSPSLFLSFFPSLSRSLSLSVSLSPSSLRASTLAEKMLLKDGRVLRFVFGPLDGTELHNLSCKKVKR